MDLFHIYKLKEIQSIIEELGLEDETSSHTTPQGQTSEGERKSHIPSVITVSRVSGALHGDRQARRTSAAEQDGNEATPRTTPVSAAPSADAHAEGRAHGPPNRSGGYEDFLFWPRNSLEIFHHFLFEILLLFRCK